MKPDQGHVTDGVERSLIERFPYGKAPFWLLAVALTSTLLLLIVRKERPPRPDLVLVTFTGPHKEAYERAIPRFERERGVKVQVQLTNWTSLQTRLQSAMLAGTDVPDLMEMLEGSLGFFTRGPRADIGLLDLTDRIKAEHLDERLVSSRLSLWTARGRVYALPHDVHPVMLAYRRDLVEALGIDVAELDTWDKFVGVGQKITRDRDGDGVLDQYMLDLPYGGHWGLTVLLLQRGGQLFNERGEVAFNSHETAEVFHWYLRQTQGPNKIAYDCGSGQSRMKVMTDGLVLFFWAPDWQSFWYQDKLPRLKGKIALMPIPAWEKGGRRTSVWGGTGLAIARRTKGPELAWDLARFLYFDPLELGKRFMGTNVIPPLKDAWKLPELNRPNPFFSGQPLGRLYADLAPETPPFYSAPVDSVARAKLDQAFSRSLRYYQQHGENGLEDKIRQELADAERYVRLMADRNQALVSRAAAGE